MSNEQAHEGEAGVTRSGPMWASDRPRTQAAQDASWAKFGNGNDYMRMIEAYAFAGDLEREVAALRSVNAAKEELLATFTEWARQVAAREDVPQGIRYAAAGLVKDAARAALQAGEQPK